MGTRIIGGIVGAGESALTGQFLMGLLAPYLIADKYQGLFFFLTVFLGAWAGVAFAPAVLCLPRATPIQTITAGFVASILGVPAGFIGAMLLFGGGRDVWIGVTVYAVHLMLFAAFLAFVHRAAKAERAREDNAATTAESNEPPAPWRRPF